MAKQFDMVPTEILHKDFSSGFMGYNKVEVEEFLEKIANHVDELQKTIIKMEEEKLTEKEKKPPVAVKNDLREEMISKALILAEQTKEDMLSNARKKSENMVAEAEIQAKKVMSDAKHYVNILEHQIMNLEEKKRHFLLKFKGELELMLSSIARDDTMKPQKTPEQKYTPSVDAKQTEESNKSVSDKVDQDIKDDKKNT